MTINEALCNIKQGYGIPHRHDTLTTIIEYVKQTEPCKDTISRQAAIKAVWDGVNMDIYTSEVKEILEALPSVQPKVVPIAEVRFDDDKLHEIVDEAVKNIEIKSGWIPVSERLPENYRRVLVSDVMGIYLGEFVDAEENWGGKHFINEHGMHSKSVKAWMPLPEPYKAESEE